MRVWMRCTAAVLVAQHGQALAADQLQFGPAASWVVPVESPPPPAASDDASSFTILLDNEQAMLEKGKRSYFGESIYRINSPQGLDDGNVTLTWDPTTETVIVHKLLLRRGKEVIDVLKSGQKFTTIRRETNLEAGMLDGRLTATLLPEGLQVGDIVELATTYVHADPVTKDSVEVELATFNGNPIARGYARLSWPSSMPLGFKAFGGLPAPKVQKKDGMSIIEYDMRDLEPLVLPKTSPARFRFVRSIDASTFANWGEVASLMKPYFDAASVIPASGPLRDEVEKLKKLPGDDRTHAEAALKLVQDGVRYVALNMGTGGYVPASAETTWSRRFGDCKAKTVLLLGILRELHIDAEAVLANTDGNDGLDGVQPQLGWFNHVLVRARVGGKSYWLDGTRTGDLSLDRIATPAFDWGLPLTAKSALVRMMPEPLAQPNYDLKLTIDAREGITLPAPTTLDYVLRGDTGRQANLAYTAKPPSQRDRFIRDFFKSVYDDWKSSIISLDPDKVSAKFDPATGEMHLTLTGMAKLDWSDSNFYVNFSTMAYKPNFERKEGINRDAPIAMEYPLYIRQVETIRLPEAFLKQELKIPDVKTTLAGVEYRRHVAFEGDAFVVDSSERSLVPEIPYAQAMADSARLRELNADSLSINVPIGYSASDKELAAQMAEKPTTVTGFMDRGNTLLDRNRYDDAIADFSGAIALDPKKALAYSSRALGYLWKGDKDRARADIQSAAALDPKDAVMLRAKGLLAEDEGKWSDAADAFTASLVQEPGNSFALGHRAIVLAEAKRDDEALADAAAALEKRPAWYGLRQVRAGIFFKRHQCDQITKDAKAASDNAEDDQGAFVLAARLYVLCKQRTEGFAVFDKALAIKPAASIYINRATSRLPSDGAGRLADIDAAIKLEPKDAGWVSFKADEVDRQGNAAKALELYEDALKLEPDSFGIGVKRAGLLHRLGRKDEAAKLFASLRTKAKDATMLNTLCWEKATDGILLDSALTDCNDALKMSPSSAAIMDSLGMTLLRLGRYDDAIKAYDKAIAGGTGAISLMGRSIAYAEKGDKTQSDADRKEALSQDPEIASRAQRYGLKF